MPIYRFKGICEGDEPRLWSYMDCDPPLSLGFPLFSSQSGNLDMLGNWKLVWEKLGRKQKIREKSLEKCYFLSSCYCGYLTHFGRIGLLRVQFCSLPVFWGGKSGWKSWEVAARYLSVLCAFVCWCATANGGAVSIERSGSVTEQHCSSCRVAFAVCARSFARLPRRSQPVSGSFHQPSG